MTVVQTLPLGWTRKGIRMLFECDLQKEKVQGHVCLVLVHLLRIKRGVTSEV